MFTHAAPAGAAWVCALELSICPAAMAIKSRFNNAGLEIFNSAIFFVFYFNEIFAYRQNF